MRTESERRDPPSVPRVTLAQWSLHRSIESRRLRGLDFPRYAREKHGFDAVELVNTLLEKNDVVSLDELRRQAGDQGVEIPLLMIDDEGDLSSLIESERLDAIDRHRRWIDRLVRLGGRAIRVNTGAEDRVGPRSRLDDPVVDRALDLAASSLATLADHAAPAAVDVLVENHGGLSASIPAIIELVGRVARANFGTLPDFGNFEELSESYEAVTAWMPFARAVSAKCFDFDERGNETRLDFPRLIDIVLAEHPGGPSGGYRGSIGIEYEGTRLDEDTGVAAAQRLLTLLIAERCGR
jgi:L-ribulose-5-phosphate 3-epimerase